MLNDDTVNTEATEPQTQVDAPDLDVTAGDPPGDAQSTSEPAATTPPKDEKAGSEPTIPLSRFNEVIRERNELRQRFQQPQQAPQQPQQAPQAPKQEDFATYEEYLDARADFRAEAKYNSLKQQDHQQAQVRQFQDRAQKSFSNFSQKLAEAVAKDPTVQAIIDSAPALRPDLQVNLGEFKDPVSLGKHLAMNPDLVYEMNNLPPDLAVQRMWSIGQSLAGSTTPPKTSVSKAPPPISPLGSGKTATSGGYRDDMSQEEFNREFKPVW